MDDNDSKWVWPFFLGFLVGVLLCLGAGGAFLSVQARRAAVAYERQREAHEALLREEVARRAAEEEAAKAAKAAGKE